MEKDLYMHHVPGRLRVKCPRLKGDEAGAQQVTEAVEALPGVERCRVSTVTGSVLCHYDAAATEAEALLDRLRGALPNPDMARQPKSQPPALQFLDAPAEGPSLVVRTRSTSAFASPLQEKIATLLLEKAVERAVVLLVRAVL